MNKLTSKDVVPGAKFGRWTVLKINVKNPNSKAKNPPRTALCQCECGQTRYKEYRDLYSGRSLSCGCLRTEQVIQRNFEKGIIEPGTRFGYLTYIKDLGYRKQQSRDQNIRWGLCKCICGREVEISHNNLKSGGTKSCGCINSRGEAKIIQILLKNNINFATEYTFNDLKGARNGSLRFDFAIFDLDNTLIKLIEFDGRQHVYGPDGSWSQCYPKELLQENDRRKNEYCKIHNIELIRIPYYDIDKIDLKYLGLENYETGL